MLDKAQEEKLASVLGCEEQPSWLEQLSWPLPSMTGPSAGMDSAGSCVWASVLGDNGVPAFLQRHLCTGSLYSKVEEGGGAV